MKRLPAEDYRRGGVSGHRDQRSQGRPRPRKPVRQPPSPSANSPVAPPPAPQPRARGAGAPPTPRAGRQPRVTLQNVASVNAPCLRRLPAWKATACRRSVRGSTPIAPKPSTQCRLDHADQRGPTTRTAWRRQSRAHRPIRTTHAKPRDNGIYGSLPHAGLASTAMAPCGKYRAGNPPATGTGTTRAAHMSAWHHPMPPFTGRSMDVDVPGKYSNLALWKPGGRGFSQLLTPLRLARLALEALSRKAPILWGMQPTPRRTTSRHHFLIAMPHSRNPRFGSTPDLPVRYHNEDGCHGPGAQPAQRPATGPTYSRQCRANLDSPGKRSPVSRSITGGPVQNERGLLCCHQAPKQCEASMDLGSVAGDHLPRTFLIDMRPRHRPLAGADWPWGMPAGMAGQRTGNCVDNVWASVPARPRYPVELPSERSVSPPPRAAWALSHAAC